MSEQIERVVVILVRVSNLKPSSVNLELNRPAVWWSFLCRDPDGEQQTVFVLDVQHQWYG